MTTDMRINALYLPKDGALENFELTLGVKSKFISHDIISTL